MQSPIAVLALRRIALTRVQHEEGQDLLECALLIGLIALVAIGAVASVGNAVYVLLADHCPKFLAGPSWSWLPVSSWRRSLT